MKSYKSHKVVQAAKIVKINQHYDVNNDTTTFHLIMDDASAVAVDEAWAVRHVPLAGGYLVVYPDGYQSFSPAAAFEEGYVEHSLDPKDGALPVAGYKPQTQEKIDIVNDFKADEERLLRKLDVMANRGIPAGVVDGRWLAIGRTQLEQAFMAINRSVFQPGRARLPDDAPAS